MDRQPRVRPLAVFRRRRAQPALPRAGLGAARADRRALVDLAARVRWPAYRRSIHPHLSGSPGMDAAPRHARRQPGDVRDRTAGAGTRCRRQFRRAVPVVPGIRNALRLLPRRAAALGIRVALQREERRTRSRHDRPRSRHVVSRVVAAVRLFCVVASARPDADRFVGDHRVGARARAALGARRRLGGHAGPIRVGSPAPAFVR